MKLYFIHPNNATVRLRVIRALSESVSHFVSVDGNVFVTSGVYQSVIAHRFVNLLDLPVDSREAYDFVAVATEPTEETQKKNPRVYDQLCRLCRVG